MREVATWPIETAVSPASCTPEWLQKVVERGAFDGSHVLSGNPQYEKIESTTDATTVERCWESDWDSQRQTVLPEPILDRATEVAEEADSVVAHHQQPHWPYVAKLDEEWLLAYDDLGSWQGSDGEVDSVQVAMQRGLISVREAQRAYRASVQSIWETLVPYLVRWIERGNTVVVTADHGETFGRLQDFLFYEHPCGCHLPPLVNVPWAEFRPAETTETGDDLEDRLRALGYAD
ncbi:hypothetical protein [Halovenus sp. HT40]|uniref:hypothetical protein n=1 Tax=Halovenus sp. HT40 TaxID=3126691 RepID=UPI00300E7693